MEERRDEEMIRRVLSNDKLRAIRDYLSQSHAIDCLLILYLECGRWKDARRLAKGAGFSLSFSTYRSRMKCLAKLRLANSNCIDSKKRRYSFTESGEKLTENLVSFFYEMDALQT